MADPVRILLPVARLISGSFYKPRDKDTNGAPLVIKNGPRAGQLRVDYSLGLAIPKTPGQTHWNQSAWGAEVYRAGQTFFPQAHQQRDFSWKVDDGDSTELNKKNKRMCDREGAPGHWILWLGGGFAPSLYARPADGTYQQLPSGPDVADAQRTVKAGDYVQAQISITSNNSTQSPGMYLNHLMVLFVQAGAEIKSSGGPDASQVFGAAPVATSMPAGVPAVPFAAAPAPAVPPQPAAVAVAPHPAILAPVAPPLPPAVPVAPAGPQMTAKAAGATYESFKGAGWTDAQMRDKGYLV